MISLCTTKIDDFRRQKKYMAIGFSGARNSVLVKLLSQGDHGYYPTTDIGKRQTHSKVTNKLRYLNNFLYFIGSTFIIPTVITISIMNSLHLNLNILNTKKF